MKRLEKIMYLVLVVLCLGHGVIAQETIPVKAPLEAAEQLVDDAKSTSVKFGNGSAVGSQGEVKPEKSSEEIPSNYKKNDIDRFENKQFPTKSDSVGSVVPKAAGKPLVDMWKLSLSCFLVLSLLVGFLYILKKFTAKYAGIKNDDVIRVVSRVPVDTKNSLMMVRVYEDELLVSVGQNGIQLLSRFNQIENEDDLIAEEKEKAEKEAKDKAVFEKVFERGVDVEEVK